MKTILSFNRVALLVGLVLFAFALPARATQTDIVGPAGSGAFGSTVTVLPNGNIVVTDPLYDAPGPVADVGAVYLLDGATLAVISTLTGSTANDQVGNLGVSVLTNGNYVVRSSLWDNGAATDAGAVTWGDGMTGVSGVVSAANSLIGSTASDQVGNGGVTVLTNGNFVVRSSLWDNGATVNAGAMTWSSGTTGMNGVVSPANSLVGSSANDQIGSTFVIALNNGNYVVCSSSWDNGALANVGAATWGNGLGGTVGAISAANSLVGSTASDQVGNGGVRALTNGNYVVGSSLWDNGAATNAGAVTWGNGTIGASGVVSAANSLVGTSPNDEVIGAVALTNGNYVVVTPTWDNGPLANAGAATWGNGLGGTVGAISAANSVVGSAASDQIGNDGVTALSNGNYVVSSSKWDNGGVIDAGAVTWGNGSGGTVGAASVANSLVGGTASDQVGRSGATALINGNYVVRSILWDNGAATDGGAVTWGSGTAGVSGVISTANSLIGSRANDQVGSGGVTVLSNGNYVVVSTEWDNGAAIDAAGAVTWGNGTTGVSGVISAVNSLVGSKFADLLGSRGAIALTNGNYVVCSPAWDNGALANVGAATWGNGLGGTVGAISAANSLVGSTASDQVGNFGALALVSGNYVVRSSLWDNGAVVDAGAATWGNGNTGASGALSVANSLVGSTVSDGVGGFADLTALANGNYVVRSLLWDNGTVLNAGAVTLGNGTVGTVGTISSDNSVLSPLGSGISGFSYDTMRDRLVVGLGASNIVSIFAYVPVITGAEMVVEQPVGVANIADGGSKAFGKVAVSSYTSLTFTIKNIGPEDLTLSGTSKVAVSGADASMFTVTAQPSSPVVGPLGTTPFTVQFTPTSLGHKTAALTIANNDSDEAPFDIILTGTGIEPVVPITSIGVETEPNDSPATANPLNGTGVKKIRGSIFPAGNADGDADYYSFSAGAGDRVHAAAMTSFSAGGNKDSTLTLLASDGFTVLETDNDDGSFGSLSSSIAGAAIPSDGIYYLKVTTHITGDQLRPYDLWVQVQAGTPVAETEPNDSSPGQALPASGWVSGALSSTADNDRYSVALNAGDTVFLSLDLDPERDGATWDGSVGLSPFGSTTTTLVSSDANVTSPNSEAFFMTVKDAGTYSARVTVPTGGTTFGTYRLNVSVLPAPVQSSTTYTSTAVPVAIIDAGVVTSTITIPDNKRIGKLKVFLNLTHNLMQDLDVTLTSPDGNIVGLFADIGSSTAGSQTGMNMGLDDDAAIPPLYGVTTGMVYQPSSNYRLEWFKGQRSQGTWTLTIRDDLAGNGGTLNGWSLEVVDEESLPPGTPAVVYSSDFETDGGGFTHSGAPDEWERGLPSFAPITTANSGVNCWKTDLDNTYTWNQNLFSPNIDLTAIPPGTPVVFQWAMKYQLASALNGGAYVEVREVEGDGISRKVWEWMGPTMTHTVGNPAVTEQESAGWGTYRAVITEFSGKTIQLRFHVNSGASSIDQAGLAIDDVSVTAFQTFSEIAVEQPAGTDLTSAVSMVDFGAGTVGTNADRVFTIRNTGTANLTSLGVTIDGANAGDFSVIASPTAPVVPGGSTTFTVRFTPGASGVRAAALHLASNDVDENPFDIALTGFGDSDGPTGGTMTLSPASPVDASAALMVSFAGWTDPSAPLNYAVLVDDVVVSAQGIPASRNFTSPATPGTHTLKGRIYDALNNVTEVTQNFTVLTAQESWRQLYFGTTANAGTAADLADPNKNGIVNFLEYALGGDPAGGTNGVSILPQPGISATNRLQITLTRFLDRNDITLTAQAADAPGGPWSNLARSINGSPFTLLDPGTTVSETGTGNTRAVTLSDVYPVNDPAHPFRFMRLEVTQ